MTRMVFRAVFWAASAATLLWASNANAQAPPPAPVAVAEVVERQVAAAQTFVGSVLPLRQSLVGSAVDGRVLEFYVNEGDRVTKGQPLAQLRTDALEIELAAGKAEQALRQHELDELNHGSRPEEIEQAKAHMLGAKALMDYRESRRNRMRELSEKNASSKDELQDSESASQFAGQTYQAAKIAYDLAVSGPRKEKVQQARARVDMAKEAVNRIQDQLQKHTIVSPFDGFVTAEHTEVGQWIAKAGLVAEVIEVSQVDVHFMALETYVPQMKVGMPARVEVDALPAEALRGKVALIVPKADMRARSFPVKVRLENRLVDGLPLLKPGMLARVSLALGKPESAILVPKDALVLGGPAPIVFAVDRSNGAGAQGTARAVPVELGVVQDNLIQVKGKLRAGERVVMQGNERLQDGQPVTIVGDPVSRRAARSKQDAATK